MSDYPSVDLWKEADGFCLQIENQEPVKLSREVFAHLARQFVKGAHELREPLEPPYVVGLVAQYNVDGDQRTPLFREAWAFAALADAQLFLEWTEADVGKFDAQWPFDLSLPAVPEMNFWWHKDSTDPVIALAEFRVICFQHFLAEAGPRFWDNLPLAERERMWRIWAAGEWQPEFDPAELEAWVAGKKELTEL